MKTAFKILITLIIPYFIGWYSAYFYYRQTYHPFVERCDTVYNNDTIVEPICKDSIVTKTIYAKLPIRGNSGFSIRNGNSSIRNGIDTIRDSIVVEVPLITRFYEDSTYKAVVSGYNVKLDSIMIKNRIITQTRIEYVKKRTHWGVGIQGGGGFGRNGLSPYIGVGISYNLFTW